MKYHRPTVNHQISNGTRFATEIFFSMECKRFVHWLKDDPGVAIIFNINFVCINDKLLPKVKCFLWATKCFFSDRLHNSAIIVFIFRKVYKLGKLFHCLLFFLLWSNHKSKCWLLILAQNVIYCHIVWASLNWCDHLLDNEVQCFVRQSFQLIRREKKLRKYYW